MEAAALALLRTHRKITEGRPIMATLLGFALALSGAGATILWIIAAILVIAGIVTILRGGVIGGIILIVVGLIIGPGGYSIFK